jgi:hypothetical protein
MEKINKLFYSILFYSILFYSILLYLWCPGDLALPTSILDSLLSARQDQDLLYMTDLHPV